MSWFWRSAANRVSSADREGATEEKNNLLSPGGFPPSLLKILLKIKFQDKNQDTLGYNTREAHFKSKTATLKSKTRRRKHVSKSRHSNGQVVNCARSSSHEAILLLSNTGQPFHQNKSLIRGS
jgi:hypothetical protein